MAKINDSLFDLSRLSIRLGHKIVLLYSTLNATSMFMCVHLMSLVRLSILSNKVSIQGKMQRIK